VNPRLLIALFLIAVFSLGAIALVANSRSGDGDSDISADGTRFEGAIMPEGVRAPDFELRDQDGEPISMRGLRGKPVVVTFLYTTCQDSCPIMAQTVRGALDQLGHDLPALAVAVDPPRDTPERA
jgi:protein SCO1